MPVPLSAPVPDPARSLWAPVTVRVAWELVLAGLPARPDAIAEAREHVLRSLPPGAGEHEAEELSTLGVREWIERVRDGRYRRPATDPDLALPLGHDWRRRLSQALDHAGDAVLRLHYGDGFPLDVVARSAAIDEIHLEQARGGIREAIRAIALEEGVSVHGWSVARLDLLIGRVARIAEPGCPGPGGLLTDEGRAHADRCPRCSRAVRLVRGGVLSPSDLFPPEHTLVRPADRRRVCAILLHPDARKHRERVSQALGEAALPIGADGWVLPEEALDAAGPALTALALEGTPARHHLRGALVTGSGRWARGRLIGPLPLQAIEGARARPWGELAGMPELPAPLPPPPRATAWWIGAAVSVLLAAATAVFVSADRGVTPTYPVQARFVPRAGAWELRFDTHDLAVVDIVAQRGGRWELAHGGVRDGKGRWATGEGDYRLQVDGQAVAIVTSAAGIPDLAARLAAASADPDPLASLSDRVHAADAHAAVLTSPGAAPSP
ncbi:hypothetical protein L6R53_06310 [Myxococcota bacterium]|nr:hypothetical protein [Myxococcota bacterium]